jgi:hypothetical protein
MRLSKFHCQPQIFITASRQNPLNAKMPRLKKISAKRRNASQSESKMSPVIGSSSFQRLLLTAARTVPPSNSQPESQTPSRGSCESSCANDAVVAFVAGYKKPTAKKFCGSRAASFSKIHEQSGFVGQKTFVVAAARCHVSKMPLVSPSASSEKPLARAAARNAFCSAKAFAR